MNAQNRSITVDAEIASILDQEVAAGRFATPAEALSHAVRTLDARRRAVARLNTIADEALGDLDDLVDFETVQTRSREAVERASAERGA